MKNKKIVKGAILCIGLLLTMVVCAACNRTKTLDLGEYFSKEEIDSWKQEGKDRKYTMNGGYFISFQGQLYPVNFEDGKINWLTTPPDEMLFVQMRELYTDAKLKKRCSYLGSYTESRLFNSDIYHMGFILDGKRPDYGSVLYMDETKERNLLLEYGDCPLFGLDDEIVPLWKGKRTEAVFARNRIAFSHDDGVFFEELNTFRKILIYAKEHGIPFDSYTEYTNLPYPGSLLWVFDNDDWMDADSVAWARIDIDRFEFSSQYHISMRYANEKYQDFNCIVFADTQAIQEFYEEIRWAIANPDDGSYSNIVTDDQGLVTQCYYKYFYGATAGRDNGAQVSKIFYSMEEFNRFLEEQNVIDDEKQASLFFSKKENGEVFDGYLDYSTMIFSLYAVWNEYHTVNLHTPDEVAENIVCINKELVLPCAMRPGYEFEGWYADENYSGQPITKVSYTDHYTDLYAKFREVETYTLTFASYDGKTFEDIQYMYGEEFSLPYVSKPFYAFKGWCTDPECKTEPRKTVSKEFFGSFHLYPCFEPQEYTITLIAGEQMLQSKVRYGENYFLLTHIAKENFIGYFDDNGVQYTDENGNSLAPFTDGADIQLFAKYKEE